MKRLAMAVVAASCAMTAACGDVVRQGRAPVQLVINSLQAASGAPGGQFGGTLLSDVATLQTINGQQAQVTFNDNGQVTLTAILKDPGHPDASAQPSAINSVTINRYRVIYRRADGRNSPGLDVPFPFDSGLTFTVAVGGTASAGFQIVRHTAKGEAPLAALAFNPDVISTLAEVTFYGQDQAGNDVSVTGTIGIDFGNFADRN